MIFINKNKFCYLVTDTKIKENKAIFNNKNI